MIKLDHLEKTVDGRTLISIERWGVEVGEIAAVVGAVGSGKTALLQLIAGEIAPSGGSVRVAGQEPRQARSEVGLLWTDDLLYKRSTVRENLRFYADLRGAKDDIDRVLNLLYLGDQADVRAEKLTEPGQRRLALARALLGRPRVLLLDEPELRTDRETRDLFCRVLTDYAQTTPAAVVIATPDTLWAARCAGRIYELQGGRIITGAVAEPDATPPVQPFKIPARKADRVMLFNPADVLYASSRDGKTYIHTADDEAVSNLTLAELDERLSRGGFFKAHRAYLVNLQRIREVVPYTKDSYLLILDDDARTQVPLSKQAAKELQDLLGY